MRPQRTHGWALALCLAAGCVTGCSHSQQTAGSSWNPKAAATYLDQREIVWMGWPSAARDHDTFCISCHTVLPYALARPALRKALAEKGTSQNERRLLDNVIKRVRLWNEIGPYYTDEGYGNGKPAESRGTEAVLNALILASHDAEDGRLADATLTAFQNMWALQQTEGEGRGSWAWLQFGMEPWEASDSKYYGAALAAIAVGTAPENYRSRPEIQAQINSLREYLNHTFTARSTINSVMLLWASTKLPGLIDTERQTHIIHEVMNQQDSDGGWGLSSTAWPSRWSLHSIVRRRLRSDWTRQDTNSDGFATGLIIFVLEQTGVSAEDPRLKRGVAWLESHQNREDGSWPSTSLTKRRNPDSNTGHFMRDAATAYAVLALTENGMAMKNTSAAQHQTDQTTATGSIVAGTRER